MAGVELDRPASEEDLYLDRGRPVPPWRPILQGDVFEGIVIPGVDDHSHLMISTHACTMRGARGRLKPKLKAIPVHRSTQVVRLEDWATRFFRVFPLPQLDEDEPGQFYAARLDEVGMVATDMLAFDRRVACLSEQGLWLFQQRLVVADTRTCLSLHTLEEAATEVLEEAELLERWNEQLAHRRVQSGETLHEALAAETEAFEDLLGPPRDNTIRARLHDAITRPSARRDVLAEIDRRCEAAGA